MKSIQRIGTLTGVQQIKGFVNVLEQWKLVYRNVDGASMNCSQRFPWI
ncbi:MAG: hypothetical protein ACYDAJ_05040 [Nitrosotalea sp.]